MSTTNAPLNIVMLCGNTRSSRMMYHALAETFHIARVVIEKKPSRLRMMRRRAKRLGLGTAAGQLLFVLFNKAVLAPRAEPRIAHLLQELGLNDAPIPESVVTRVESVNAPETVHLLQTLQPDAVVINGTRIIAKRVLTATDAPFLNTHVGITPRYRGVHGGYWALAMDDAEHCGVTVHLVDEGIDTGNVLYQATIHPTPQDSFNTYPILQIGAAIPLMRAALTDIQRGTLTPREGVPPSRLWYHPTLWQYFKYRLRGVK